MVGGAAAHGLTDQVAGDVVAVLLQVGLVGGNAHGLFVGELLIHLVQQHLAGVLLAQVGLCLLGIDLGLQLEGLVLGFQNRFLALLVCGLDRFVHQAGRLGFGAADLCFGGLFPVVVTNKIARSCTDNTHDQGHDHFDRGHRVHSPLF